MDHLKLTSLYAEDMSDSGVSDEPDSEANGLENKCSKLRVNLGKLETLVEMNEDSLKLESLISALNNFIENQISVYESDIETDDFTDSNYEPEPKRSREIESSEISLVDLFMTRCVQRRSVGILMTTLILKMSTISNLSSRQIFSTVNFMQSELKLWNPELFAKGMPTDRTIRSISYRLFGLHQFFVKQYLANSEYLFLCTDGASIGFKII